MLGKKDWFRRKDMGWGIEPVTWQGWVYMLVFIAFLLLITNGPEAWFFKPRARSIAAASWVVLFLADVIHLWFAVGDGRIHRNQTKRPRNQA
ncbi:hypothetical protein LLH00_06740 [bacterium]|nr:hypothetical protein [bacterium]